MAHFVVAPHKIILIVCPYTPRIILLARLELCHLYRSSGQIHALWCTLSPMKVLIVTPLYPPDIAGSAPYVKELARRLAKHYTVTILAYGHIPEEIPGVTITTVEKRDHVFVRLFAFTRALIRAMKGADIVYVENGPSVELPLCIARCIRRTRTIFHVYDTTALTRAKQSLWYRLTFLLAQAVSHRVLLHDDTRATFEAIAWRTHNRLVCTPRPLPRPEILPFSPVPKDALDAYEHSWNAHKESLESIFAH